MESSENNIVETSKEMPKKVWLKKEALSTDAFVIALSIFVGAIIIALTLSLPTGMKKAGMPSNKAGVAEQAEAPLDPANKEVTTTIDNDPVLGDRNKAKVAIIEFSDLECPFCKRFHQETYDQLVKEYIDTGKAVFVARDFPLSFHDPKATEEAAVAECVRDQKNDAAYFSFTKDIYANTLTNGKGLPEGKMMELLKKAGVDSKKALDCSESAVIKEDIAKDIADGTKIGITGTPSFVIGTLSDDGTVTGEVVVGALPLAGFQEVLNKYLPQ